jgi:Putative prokaryotic signal transducing protein
MKELLQSADTVLLGLYQSMLADAGIATFIRNAATQQTVVGGLVTAVFPLPSFNPTLCVVDDSDYPEAMQILSSVKDGPPSTAPDWRCPRCSETVPGNFTDCWKCGATPAPP